MCIKSKLHGVFICRGSELKRSRVANRQWYFWWEKISIDKDKKIRLNVFCVENKNVLTFLESGSPVLGTGGMSRNLDLLWMSGQGHFEEWRGLRSMMKVCAGVTLCRFLKGWKTSINLLEHHVFPGQGTYPKTQGNVSGFPVHKHSDHSVSRKKENFLRKNIDQHYYLLSNKQIIIAKESQGISWVSRVLQKHLQSLDEGD